MALPSPHPPALALLLFVLLNAGVQLGFYLHNLTALGLTALEPPSLLAQGIFVSFISALLLAFALGLYGLGRLELRLRGGVAITVVFSVFVEALALFVIGLDTQLYENLGLHLYSSYVTDALTNPDAQGALHVSVATLRSMVLYIVAALAFGAALYAGCKKLEALDHERALALGRGALPAALVLVLSGSTAAFALRPTLEGPALVFLEGLPFFSSLSGDHAYTPSTGAHSYPPPLPTDLKPRARPDILFVLVESWRADALNPEDMPGLSALAPRCTQPGRHYAGGHTSEYGAFTLLYGVNGYHFEPFRLGQIESFPLQVLQSLGYERVGASSSALAHWNGAGFITQPLDRYEEFLDTTTWRDDRDLAHWVSEQLDGTERTTPRFVFAFFNATHHNYLYPPEHEHHTPVLPADYDHFMGDSKLEQYQTEVINRYRNSLRFVDDLLSETLAPHQERIERGELVVVITGDHGEEFWEHGLLGHGAPRFTNGRTQVPMLVCGTSAPMPGATVTAHVDVWPTLLQALFDAPLSPSQYSDGRSWLLPPEDRSLVLGGLDFPWDTRSAALVTPTHKVWLQLCPNAPLCLQPVRVTDHLDRARPLSEAQPVLEPYLEDFYQNAQRFITIE